VVEGVGPRPIGGSGVPLSWFASSRLADRITGGPRVNG